MLSNKNISLLVGVALGVVFLALTPKSWKAISEIKDRQITANLRLSEWKDAYHALLPVNDLWVKAYQDGHKAKDIVSLYRLIGLSRYKLNADIDKVTQSASSDVLVNGVSVGLQRLCVASGGAGMTIEANSIKELRAGLRSLAMRNDIDMGELVFRFDALSSKPTAIVSGLCLKVRVDGEDKGEAL